MENNTGYWDPISNIRTDVFDDERTELLKKVTQYKNHPYIIPFYVFESFIFPIIALIFIFFAHLFNQIGFYIFALSFFPFFYFYRLKVSLQNELVLYFLCQKNNWIYHPKLDTESVEGLIMNYPTVFNKGHDQSLEDQVWGNLSPEYIDFWKGLFNYTVDYGRSSHTYQKTIFALKLKTKIPYSFSLNRANALDHMSDLKTESVEFNTLFNVKEENKDEKQEIIKILSPSVQIRLTNFSKIYKPETIYFKNNVVYFVFGKDIFKTKYTNFLKKVAIDERDEDSFNNAIKDMAQLPAEMVQFIQ